MFDGMVGRFLQDSPQLAGKSILGMESDSWEAGQPEWSADFRDEFTTRRGYDPVPWLVGLRGGPKVGGGDLDKRFAYDLTLTQADLFADNFFSYLTDSCSQRGMDFMTKPYEGPFDPVRCGGRTARPMGEFWATGDRKHTIRWAASAATTYGRRMAGAEAFTGRWSDGNWDIDPHALKRIGDLAFGNGLNKMTLHCSALQPWGDKVKPGIGMGFWGSMVTPGQTWWEPGRAWIDYISRCQSLLQQGHNVVQAQRNGVYEVSLASGSKAEAVVSGVPAPMPFEGAWNAKFPAGWGAPAGTEMELNSWTKHPDAGVRYFSGTAPYVREFDLPADFLGKDLTPFLDLGLVKNLAEVVVNGQSAGVLRKPPFRAEVTGLLKPDRNRLEIKMTNLWLNRMVGDEQIPDDCEWGDARSMCNDFAGQGIKRIPDWVRTGGPRPQTNRYTFTTWKFYNKNTPLLESGLLGPITLRVSKKVTIK
jgi:hypothetical protein